MVAAGDESEHSGPEAVRPIRVTRASGAASDLGHPERRRSDRQERPGLDYVGHTQNRRFDSGVHRAETALRTFPTGLFCDQRGSRAPSVICFDTHGPNILNGSDQQNNTVHGARANYQLCTN